MTGDERAIAAGLDEVGRELTAARAGLARAQDACDAIRAKLEALLRQPPPLDSSATEGVESEGGAMR